MSENKVFSKSRLYLKFLGMEVKFQKKIKKLFEKRSNLKNELYKCHEIILEYIESQSRCSKIDTYIEKCRNYIEQAVEINSELIDMATKSANPDELIPAQDMWLHKLTQSNDKVLQEAITCKTSFEAVTEPDKIDSSSKVSHHSEKSENPGRIKQIPALSCRIEAADISNRVLRNLVIPPLRRKHFLRKSAI